MGFIGFLLLSGVLYIWVCLTKYPERLINKKTGQPYTKQEFKYPLIAAALVGLVCLALPSDNQSSPTAQQVIASSGVKSDEQVSISTTENGAVAIEPVQEAAPVTPADVEKIRATKIAALLPIIKKVEFWGDVIEIHIGTADGFTEAQTFASVGRDADRVLQELLKKLPEENPSHVRFVSYFDVIDSYNNRSNERGIGIMYDYQEVKKFNFDENYLYQDLMRFAEFKHYSPLAIDSYRAWCGKETNLRRSGDFCRSM